MAGDTICVTHLAQGMGHMKAEQAWLTRRWRYNTCHSLGTGHEACLRWLEMAGDTMCHSLGTGHEAWLTRHRA